MTAPARPRTVRQAAPANPFRAKALAYLRSGRVCVRWSGWEHLNGPVTIVRAIIRPADQGQWGFSVPVQVDLNNGVWTCTDHPGENSCAHRLAVQTVTGWEHLGGRWTA